MLENSKHAITENEVLMKMARESLKDKWGLATGLTLVVLFIVIVLGAIPIIGQIYLSIISGPIALGLAIFSLSISRNKDARIEQVFKGFNNFVTTLVVYLLMLLFVLFWSILLIIPGIVAACSYSMTYYILADDNSIGAMEAIDKSKKMMYGYKLKYFYLNLRFTGWVILSILTFGIGFLWLYPYIIVSTSKFYDDIKDKQITNEQDLSSDIYNYTTQLQPKIKRLYQKYIKALIILIIIFVLGALFYLKQEQEQELEEIKAKKEKIKEYNKAIEINPQDAEAYDNRGSAKWDLGDYWGAKADWFKANEIRKQEKNKRIQ